MAQSQKVGMTSFAEPGHRIAPTSMQSDAKNFSIQKQKRALTGPFLTLES